MPAPIRRTVAMALDETAKKIADFACSVFDGDRTRYAAKYRPDRVVYPTRLNFEMLVKMALMPHTEKPKQFYGETAAYPEGISLNELFYTSAEKVLADEGDDSDAMNLLVELYDRIMEGDSSWNGSPAQIARAVKVLASFDPESLWYRAVTSALPDEPQTPGSPAWNKETEKAAQQGREPHRETSANPFAGK